MKSLKLLVVDDDDLVIQSVRMALPEHWQVQGFNSPHEVPEESFHAALIDMHLTGNLAKAEGVELIKKLSQSQARLEIVAMSGNLDRNLMEKCLKAGASRFLAKPLSVDELLLTLEKIEALYLLQGAVQRGGSHVDLRWVGQGPASKEVHRIIASMTGEPGPILIEGESGTGKEVTAQLLKGSGPFIAVNVAAIPENLFESEFFGHMRGAFTGADQNKMGLAEAAQGGDLFLDEIEALSLPLQVKLLRFLETGEIRRLGSKESTQVHVRVIAATNRNLNQLVNEGQFREDLLWRLAGKKIVLPPLRHRLEDIKELAEYFISKDRYRHKELSEDALEALKDYHWPGNVRELKRVCEQLLITSPLPLIRREDVLSLLQTSSSNYNAQALDLKLGLSTLLEQFEAHAIRTCLDQYPDMDETAKVLKVSRSSLYKKLRDYNIQGKDK